MKDRCLPSRRTARQWAAVARELAVPVPFELTEFRARIERHTQRVVELIPAVMREGAPSGTWLRTASADYFYYEEQTSPFHQAHIVLSLVAHLLLGDVAGPSVDPRVRGREKVPVCGRVEVAAGGRLKVPIPRSSCRPGG